jgi:hypothetical protein
MYQVVNAMTEGALQFVGKYGPYVAGGVVVLVGFGVLVRFVSMFSSGGAKEQHAPRR